jgi:Spy/CpxP family protein refolding chaperone
MKLISTLGSALVATATLSAGVAFAAVGTTPETATTTTTAPAHAGKHWQHRGGGMLVGVMLRATRQLNLTAEQQSTIKGILSASRAQHQAAAGTAGIDSMMTLANPGDPNYATALQSAKANAATRLQNEVQVQGQIYNVLTADQKAKLPQVLADMKTKFEQRRAAWQQQHGAAQSGAAGSN